MSQNGLMKLWFGLMFFVNFVEDLVSKSPVIAGVPRIPFHAHGSVQRNLVSVVYASQHTSQQNYVFVS